MRPSGARWQHLNDKRLCCLLPSAATDWRIKLAAQVSGNCPKWHPSRHQHLNGSANKLVPGRGRHWSVSIDAARWVGREICQIVRQQVATSCLLRGHSIVTSLTRVDSWSEFISTWSVTFGWSVDRFVGRRRRWRHRQSGPVEGFTAVGPGPLVASGKSVSETRVFRSSSRSSP